jgi:Tol biopolymer transport system component
VISGNGRFVTFQTSADNLGGPTDVSPFIYVHDLERHTTRLISRQSAAAGGAGADGSSADPWISGSGRFVTFETGADNLGGPLEDVQNVYVYDRKTRRVKLASRERGGGPGGDGGSFDPSISLDGRFVAFRTLADNLGGPLDVNVGNSTSTSSAAERCRAGASAGGGRRGEERVGVERDDVPGEGCRLLTSAAS